MVFCFPIPGGKVGIYVSSDYMWPKRFQKTKGPVDIFILGTMIWVGCLSWRDIKVRDVELFMLGEVQFDSLDFGFTDIDLLRNLYGGISDVFMDVDDETTPLFVLPVSSMSGVVHYFWSSMVLLLLLLLCGPGSFPVH